MGKTLIKCTLGYRCSCTSGVLICVQHVHLELDVLEKRLYLWSVSAIKYMLRKRETRMVGASFLFLLSLGLGTDERIVETPGLFP